MLKPRSAFFLAFVFLGLIGMFSACEKDPPIPDPEPPVYDINFRVPAGWPQPVYSFENNTLTESGFRLGRKLFYDPRLSRDNTISCGSCHQAFAAFSHLSHPVSHGIDGLLGTRNAPPLYNLNWHPSFMWDGGINHIEVQPLAPITNPVEMDEKIPTVIAKIQQDPDYKKLFNAVYGDETVNSQRIFKAIAQFQGMLVSANSKYDQVMRGDAGVAFTPQEEHGLNVFRANCASCHKEPLFSDFSFRNNGLSVNTTYHDSGRAHITKLATDRFKFKVPSLRNITLTEPYMHDGRFQTLQKCIDHYVKGVQQTENLDPLLTSGIALTTQEQQDLIRFLQTLADNSFVKDVRFQDPN
jgi:cytochrome c peroxidase